MEQGEYEYMYINESENKETTRNNKAVIDHIPPS
jgi:hypothetical protein